MAQANNCGSRSHGASRSNAIDVEVADESGPKDSGSHTHAIDIDVNSNSPSSSATACAVCMEDVEWAAYGWCVHPDVICGECALRIRSSGRSTRECCICKAHCPTVLVTKLRAAGAGDEPWEPPPPPAAAVAQGKGGAVEYWYHEGVAAYFDDEEQYRKAKALLALRPFAALGLPPAIWPTRVDLSSDSEEDSDAVNSHDDEGLLCSPEILGVLGFFIALFIIANIIFIANQLNEW